MGKIIEIDGDYAKIEYIDSNYEISYKEIPLKSLYITKNYTIDAFSVQEDILFKSLNKEMKGLVLGIGKKHMKILAYGTNEILTLHKRKCRLF